MPLSGSFFRHLIEKTMILIAPLLCPRPASPVTSLSAAFLPLHTPSLPCTEPATNSSARKFAPIPSERPEPLRNSLSSNQDAQLLPTLPSSLLAPEADLGLSYARAISSRKPGVPGSQKPPRLAITAAQTASLLPLFSFLANRVRSSFPGQHRVLAQPWKVQGAGRCRSQAEVAHIV
ncbi:hypothetical protein CRG98_002827 [Punica granatum]|uniref:Uncharacterized protein n=1 Tax=Punica granatum TaxID=22663 RepID=A0A2I0L823_PUNGR|nr:hypothetical protein CRG98_002827 [Punica granatum]